MAMYKIDDSVLKIIYLVITVISNTLVACVTAALPEIKKLEFFPLEERQLWHGLTYSYLFRT